MFKNQRHFEPARVRAVLTALVALGAALGIAIPAGVDSTITALIGALAVLLPLLQGEATRAVVTPSVVAVQHVDDLTDVSRDVEVDDGIDWAEDKLGEPDPATDAPTPGA